MTDFGRPIGNSALESELNPDSSVANVKAEAQTANDNNNMI